MVNGVLFMYSRECFSGWLAGRLVYMDRNGSVEITSTAHTRIHNANTAYPKQLLRTSLHIHYTKRPYTLPYPTLPYLTLHYIGRPPMQHGFTIRRPARLLIQLNPPIIHVLAPREPIVRALGQSSSSRLKGAGKGLSDPAEGVGEEDVGDWEVGTEDAAEGFEDGHDAEGDADPWFVCCQHFGRMGVPRLGGLQVKSVEPCANITDSRTELMMHVLRCCCQCGRLESV